MRHLSTERTTKAQKDKWYLMVSTFLTVPTPTFRPQILIQNVTVIAESVDP